MTDLQKLLIRIAELQATTAPVTLTIGGTNQSGMVTRDCVTIHNAPPKVLRAIVTEFDFVSLTNDGARVAGVWPWPTGNE